MKVRDSGMPEENLWNTFFDTELILSELQVNSQINNLVEIGSGYGTFTIPASKRINGKVFAFYIEVGMINSLKEKASKFKIENVEAAQRDILSQSTGLEDSSVDYVMFFNILHHESPISFFDESYRILKPNGKIGIIHWRSDIPTPRGPDISIRPKPEQIIDWVDKNKFQINKEPFIIKPYHYGLILS